MRAVVPENKACLRTGERFRRVVGDGESIVESLGIPSLRPVDPAAFEEYEREMREVVIPEIEQAVRRRARLAHEARQRWLG